MFKYILATLLCFIAIPGLAQQTKSTLNAEISTNFPNNTTGQITPAKLRSTLNNIVNSYYDLNGTSAVTCAVNQWATGMPTLSSLSCAQPGISNLSGFGTGVVTALGINVGTVGGILLNGSTAGGDLTGTYPNPILATVNSNVGSFGSSTNCVTITVNAKGLITAASETACAGGGGGTPGGSSGQIQYNNTGAFGGFTTSGDATINTGSGALTLSTVNANVGTFGSVTSCITTTANAKGLITAISAATCTPAISSITGLGTGIATALAVNVGSAGAPVLFNGAGGTPTSMVGTNITSLNASQLNTGTIPDGRINATITPQGRITLTSGLPVQVASSAAATSVFYTPANGNLVPLFDGTNWTPTSISQLTITLGANWTTNSNWDVFIALDGSTVRACTGPAWTSDTGRGTGAGTTELVRNSGLLLNNVTITCRYNNTTTFSVAASRGTYVGSFRTGTAGQTNFVPGAAGTPGLIGIWNMYNRVAVPMWAAVGAANYTYSTATVRQLGGNTNVQVQLISGFAEDGIDASVSIVTTLSAVVGAYKEYYVALDSTTIGNCSTAVQNGVAVAAQFASTCRISYAPQLGWHTIAGLELGDGANNNTVIGQKYTSLTVNTRF